jgi:uncharacterized iron-regulated membrane protein
MKFSLLNRKIHYWGSITIAVQLFIVLISGVLLLLKKELDWIQPPTVNGEKTGVAVEFDRILEIAKTVPEASILSWSDIDRLDVRPGKGMLKVQSKNRWEIQINAHSGEVLQVAYRRSDLIESIHDGSFFGSYCKLWFFLPSAAVVILLWGTGMYLFFYPYYIKARRRRREQRTIFARNLQ